MMLLLAGIGLCFGAGCGEDDQEDPTDPYAEISDEALGVAITGDALCIAGWECVEDDGTVAETSSNNTGRFESLDTCRQSIRDAGLEEVENPLLSRAVEEGRLVVDRHRIEGCRDAIVDRLCSREPVGFDDASRYPEECLALFVGQQEVDEPCVSSIECRGSMYCEDTFEGDVCYGTCQVGTSPPTSTCAGETCGSDEYCKTEFEDQWCESLEPAGEPCEASSNCQRGLYCSDVQDECVELNVVAADESCRRRVDVCEPGYRCSTEAVDGGDSVLDGECVEVGKDGNTCRNHSDCHAEFLCIENSEEESGECVAAGSIGEACIDQADCRSGYCDDGECAELLDDGSSCEQSSQCDSGFCHFDDGECAPQLPNGEPCHATDQCESGYCAEDGNGEQSEPVCQPVPVCEIPETGS